MAEIGAEKAIMDYVCKLCGVTPDEVKVEKIGNLKYNITITPKEKMEELTVEIEV